MDKSNSSREICIKFKQMISLLYKIINRELQPQFMDYYCFKLRSTLNLKEWSH